MNIDQRNYAFKTASIFVDRGTDNTVKGTSGDFSTLETATNNKLLNVWYRSDNLNDFNKNCSQYFEISKYFTEQECDKLNKTDNELIGRNKNFPLYNQIETLILKLLKKSQK